MFLLDDQAPKGGQLGVITRCTAIYGTLQLRSIFQEGESDPGSTMRFDEFDLLECWLRIHHSAVVGAILDQSVARTAAARSSNNSYCMSPYYLDASH